jgi:NAD(P)-dependent dehydrogenase (short-subunit alcohol dehydrogenase family)
MDMAISGLRALVTGGSRGIGFAIVSALAEEGVDVTFCGRDAAVGERSAATLGAAGFRASFLAADVESDPGVDALAEQVLADGPIDILVNNVGGTHDPDAGMRPFTAIPPGDWTLTFAKCVFSAVRLIDRIVPAMRRKAWGRVINISSIAGLEPAHAPADYAAAKAAMNTMTVSLAQSLSRTGVTANVVSPGPILTDALAAYIDVTARARGWAERGAALEARFIAELMPIKTTRLGRPADIGAAVAYLASPRADYITGAHLRIDGGLSAAAI